MARIHWIERAGPGRLGVMGRPGRIRSLEHDLQAVAREGTDVLVSLLTPENEAKFDLGEERVLAERHGLEFKSFPIRERSVPAADMGTSEFLRARLRELRNGRTVVLHGASGRGRTTLVAGSLLVMEGVDPDTALARVRGGRRTTVPTTQEQADWIGDLARRLGRPAGSPQRLTNRTLWTAAAAAAVVSLVLIGVWTQRRRS